MSTVDEVRIEWLNETTSVNGLARLRAALDEAAGKSQRTAITRNDVPVAYIVPAEQGEFLEQFENGQAVAVDLNMKPAAPGPDWREGWQEVAVAEPKINLAQLSVLLSRMVELSGITPRVLGVPDGPGSLPERIDRMLRDG